MNIRISWQESISIDKETIISDCAWTIPLSSQKVLKKELRQRYKRGGYDNKLKGFLENFITALPRLSIRRDENSEWFGEYLIQLQRLYTLRECTAFPTEYKKA